MVKLVTSKGHVVIENVTPAINGGRFPVSAVVGDAIEVAADVFRDGPELLQVVLRYKGPADRRWSESPMTLVDNDRWIGTFSPDRLGRWCYTIEAWTDVFASWRRDLIRKIEAGQEDVTLEVEEGARIIEARLGAIPAKKRAAVGEAVARIRTKPDAKGDGFSDARVVAALSDVVSMAMVEYPDRSGSSTYKPVLEVHAERERARNGAWYEMFPRSTGTKTKHGTFRTAIEDLPRIADMGFDVVYLPPIHPIGRAFRKGPNNSLKAGPKDVGSPWAIGGPEGGHDAVHPDLGTLDDFDAFVAAADRLGLEVALDFAIQCSPDHPWVKEHPEWFHHRPDGSIKYAENPPKKYQDVYPVNFDTEDRDALWLELKRVVDHWIAHGVKIFRVDNPHTKPFAFWEWLIGRVQEEQPDVVFLSEAFTRPKVMQRLAKLGFSQSYTYFTWRNEKWDLTEYLTELTTTEMRHYFRPNFFVNTPDILHEYLQTGGPPAFRVRLILAAFLAPSYGVYSGYELFENVPVRPGSEEYLNSEKYELRPRDYSGSPNMMPFITRVNEIRHKHPATTELTNLRFHEIDKEALIAFSKRSADGETLLVIANLDPFQPTEGTTHLDLGALGIDASRSFEVHDLLSDETYTWHGPHNYVRLDPQVAPAHVFKVGS